MSKTSEPTREDPRTPDEDDDELSDEELGGLLGRQLFPIDESDAFDAEEASELDIGEDETTELEEEGDEGLASLDLGAENEFLIPTEEHERRREDDESASELEVDSALPEAGMFALGDDAEGPDSFGDVSEPELPALEIDDELEGVQDDESSGLPTGWASPDEARPKPGAKALRELTTSLTLEACSALALAGGAVVAASTDLFWFANGALTPLRLEAGSSRIHSLALTKTGWDYAVCATASGRLIRRGRLAAASEELSGLRGLGGGPELFDLCQPGQSFPHALIVRSARGLLLQSDDDARSFRRVSEQRVRAISPQGTPALALTYEATLLESDDGGGTFRERVLPENVRDVVHGDAPLIAGHGSVIALADPSLGVAVSVDAAESFRPVPGTTGVSAISVSLVEARPTVFAALYDDSDRSYIVRIDPATASAETVAVIEFPNPNSDDSLDVARVVRIEWDSVYERLWLAGGFGVKVFALA